MILDVSACTSIFRPCDEAAVGTRMLNIWHQSAGISNALVLNIPQSVSGAHYIFSMPI